MSDYEVEWDDRPDWDDDDVVDIPTDLDASGSCAIGYIRDGVPHGPTIHTAPATFIVGDAWLTLQRGMTRWVQVPAGVQPRLATADDVRLAPPADTDG